MKPPQQHSDLDDGKKPQGKDMAQGSKGSQPLVAQKATFGGEASVPESISKTYGLPWIGEQRKNLSMVYVSGDDPWEFHLGYCDDRRQSIEEAIKNKQAEGLLEQCHPEVGKLVVCRSSAHKNQYVCFRGLITRYNAKVRGGIRNVVAYKLDHGGTEPVFAADVYSLPPDLAAIPSHVVKCRLLEGEHQLKEKFGKELRLAFRDVLKNSVLTVNLDNHDDTKPPCFSAVVWAFDVGKCIVDVDLNLWIRNKVIPRLKAIPPEDSDVFMYVRERDIMDPYYDDDGDTDVAPAVSEQLGEPVTVNGVQPVMDGIRSPPANETDDVIAERQPSVHVLSCNNEEPPYDALVSQANGESTFSLIGMKPPFEAVHSPPASGETDVVQCIKELAKEVPVGLVMPAVNSLHSRFAALDSAVSNGQAQEKPPSNDLQKLPNNVNRLPALDKTPATPESKADSFVLVTKPNEEDDFDCAVTSLQEEYQPTDERRICQFFQKRGFCGRKLCNKEHVEKSPLWTTDVIPIYDMLFNELSLPADGSEVVLKIQHLKSPVSFYVNLSDEYSDTGERGALETSATLHGDLNSLQNNNTHPFLPVGPHNTELVLAMGQQDSLGPRRKWLRARVLQVLDDIRVEVFFLDFGNKAVVKTKDLRAIRPRFLHLPAQAVLTRLYNLEPVPEKQDVALKFLNTTIVQKELKAEVIDQHDGELDVLLFLENGESLNDVLLRQNFAKTI